MNVRVIGWSGQRETQEEKQSEKYDLLGRRLNYHLPLVKMTVTHGCPAKAYHMMGKARFQPTITLAYTHSRTVTDKRTSTYTHLHMQSFAVSATRCMLSSHTLQGQDFHHKIISRERSHAEPHSPISEQPTSSDKFVSECTVSFLRQVQWDTATATLMVLTSAPNFTILYCFDISQQRISDAVTYISVLPNATKGSWSESVSQLQSVSYVILLSVCIQPYRLSSRSHSLCGQRGELAAFFTLLSLLIILVSHATLSQMHTVFQQDYRGISL